MIFEPIGVFHADNRHPYEARRQAAADHELSLGEIVLRPNMDFEQALEDLAGFERIWIIFEFHHNKDWKPKTMPPRGPRTKRGVFATRAPYRPNQIGLSCVKLVKIDGLKVHIGGHDLLDGTPVLDIKPYIPYADSFPNAKTGWLENIEDTKWDVQFSARAEAQLEWLEQNGVTQIRGFIQAQLEFDPLDRKRKRVEMRNGKYQLAYRTWRANFKTMEDDRKIQVEEIESGYSETDLKSPDDPYSDKSIHRSFK